MSSDLKSLEASLCKIVDDSTYNEGNGDFADVAMEHFNISMSLLEQAIAHLKIAQSMENLQRLMSEDSIDAGSM